MPIPGFNNKTAESPDLLPAGYISAADHSSKALPDLAALAIKLSAFLRFIYRLGFGLFALALLLAFYPYLADGNSSNLQRLLLTLVLLLCELWLWFCCRVQLRSIPAGTLAFNSGTWHWADTGGGREYQLHGAVVCWPWLIIVPLVDAASRRKLTLVLAKDALNTADRARLRTWLRACLKPRA